MPAARSDHHQMAGPKHRGARVRARPAAATDAGTTRPPLRAGLESLVSRHHATGLPGSLQRTVPDGGATHDARLTRSVDHVYRLTPDVAVATEPRAKADVDHKGALKVSEAVERGGVPAAALDARVELSPVARSLHIFCGREHRLRAFWLWVFRGRGYASGSVRGEQTTPVPADSRVPGAVSAGLAPAWSGRRHAFPWRLRALMERTTTGALPTAHRDHARLTQPAGRAVLKISPKLARALPLEKLEIVDLNVDPTWRSMVRQ